MTLQEILKAQNLTDEQISGITSAMKENKIYTAGEENLDIRFNKLKTEHEALTKKSAESESLIAELQKATEGQSQVQEKIAEYEAKLQQQEEALAAEKAQSALKIGLLSGGAKAGDIDYLIYKMSHDDSWKVELDENGQVKGLDDKLTNLKTQFPSQFEGSSKKSIEEKRLEKPDPEARVSKEDFAKMGYKARVSLKEQNPDLYSELTKQ